MRCKIFTTRSRSEPSVATTHAMHTEVNNVTQRTRASLPTDAGINQITPHPTRDELIAINKHGTKVLTIQILPLIPNNLFTHRTRPTLQKSMVRADAATTLGAGHPNFKSNQAIGKERSRMPPSVIW